jgi:hypothetical protein
MGPGDLFLLACVVGSIPSMGFDQPDCCNVRLSPKCRIVARVSSFMVESLPPLKDTLKTQCLPALATGGVDG